MAERIERRHHCERIIGVERRGAPIQTLEGRRLPDPTRLMDEDFIEPLEERLEALPPSSEG